MSLSSGNVGQRWTIRSAYDQLSRAQKPAFGTPAYSRFVNRPAGRWLAAVAATAGISPNQVSGASALCSFGAIALLGFVPASPVVGVLVALLLLLGYALDSADGQVARLLGTRSLFGEWLDHMIDCTKTSALHLAVLVQLYRFNDLEARWLLVPMVYLITANVLFFGMILVDQLRRLVGSTSTKTDGSLGITRSIAILPSDYGALCIIFTSLAWTPVFLGMYSLFAVGALLLLGAALAKWVRELRAADRERNIP